MNTKILQIIPAPAGLRAHYHNKEVEAWSTPIVCLALVEDSNAFRSVEPMEMYADGTVAIVGDVEGRDDEGNEAFKEITFPED